MSYTFRNNTMKRNLCLLIPTIITASLMSTAQAVPVSGQGTWEATLQGRDLDGNASTFEAYYDTTLDITWLADANAAGTFMNWADSNLWAANLDVHGTTGWCLPTNTPINGSSYNTSFTTNATSDDGYADSLGWVDNSGNPVSEMGHMYYVTLGNPGFCPPDGGDGNPATCDNMGPINFVGLTNTGDFSNVQSDTYWSGSELNSSNAWYFLFDFGFQDYVNDKEDFFYSAWAVHSGDVSAVPVPATMWLFGSGLIGLLGLAKHKH